MGLMSKLKNILFEEEEVEIPVLEKKEKKQESEYVYREMPKKEEVRQTPDYSSFYNDTEEQPRRKETVQQSFETARMPREEVGTNQIESSNAKRVIQRNQIDNREPRRPVREEKSFNFPSFDEEEFKSAMPRRSTNILEHERKKEEKKTEYKAPVKKDETTNVKQKFKPSPIISPVYGILDKNYTPEDITTSNVNITNRTLDVDSVRKKAFGTLEEMKSEEKKETIMPKLVNEETEDKILEEKLEKARTIDELLRDSSDEVIEIEDSKEDIQSNTLEDDVINEIENVEPQHEETEDDTLESDLFDLIDSMYENREDGE